MKEGHEVTLAKVMEIVRLEVSTQQHLDRMQETAKVNYVQYGKSMKHKKSKKSSHSGTSRANHRGDKGHGTSSKPGGKDKKLPFPQDTCYRCEKGRHQKTQDCKAFYTVCRGCGKKGHFEKVCLKAKHSTHLLEVPQASTSSAGAGASEPLFFDDDRQPIFAHMVSVLHLNKQKHLIKFPIALDYRTLRGNSEWKGVENLSNSTKCSQTVLLKANTGADGNLMNKQTFDQLFGDVRNLLQLTAIRMENYGNSAVKVLGMFHAFLRWKDKVYRQLFYVTNCDRSPNILSHDACYTLGILKPCYTMVKRGESNGNPRNSTQNDTKTGHSFSHQTMNGTKKRLSNSSIKHSITKEQLQGSPLTKQDILDVYTDTFTGIGKFPGPPYKFQLKLNAKPTRHTPRKVPIHFQESFHKEIRNLEALGILEETKDVTEWINSFVIVEKKLPVNSSNSHSPGHSVNKKIQICLFTET